MNIIKERYYTMGNGNSRNMTANKSMDRLSQENQIIIQQLQKQLLQNQIEFQRIQMNATQRQNNYQRGNNYSQGNIINGNRGGDNNARQNHILNNKENHLDPLIHNHQNYH